MTRGACSVTEGLTVVWRLFLNAFVIAWMMNKVFSIKDRCGRSGRGAVFRNAQVFRSSGASYRSFHF